MPPFQRKVVVLAMAQHASGGCIDVGGDTSGGLQSATPETETTEEVSTGTTLDNPWRVILYNDDVHAFDEVIAQLIKATGCSIATAEQIAWRAHTEGKAKAFEGSFEDCFRVQNVLREIALVTEIEG